MNDELRREVARWLRYAEEDLQEAERLTGLPGVVPRHPAWLAQQAGEAREGSDLDLLVVIARVRELRQLLQKTNSCRSFPEVSAPIPMEPNVAPRKPIPPIPEPVAVRSSNEVLTVELSDGRTVTAPLVWYPRLTYATADERAVVELTSCGIHWPLVNEDVSVEMLLGGWPSAESPSSLKAWMELMERRRAQIARGEEPEPHYPTLPLPDWWDEDDGDGASAQTEG